MADQTELKYYCDTERHLICYPYSEENLRTMGDDLGIGRHFFHNTRGYPHYDIPLRRMEEIMAKCTIISSIDLVKIIRGQKPPKS